MKRILILSLLLIVSGYLFAQQANKKLNYSPQTPNAAALFKYVETPVSYYNGTVNFSIPVYQIVVGKVEIPITLEYHSSGIKVTEEASWVGLGWNLQASGSISHSVVGRRDEEEILNNPSCLAYNIVPNSPNGRNGKPMNVVERGTCFPDKYGVIRNFSALQGPCNGSGINYLGSSDRQYDLFVFSVAGHSGKFFNPKLNYYEDKYVTLENSNIKITRYDNAVGEDGFLLTTPDGTKYLFNSIESTVSQGGPGMSSVTNTWHLTSVTTVEGRTINFTYKTIFTTLFPMASQSFIISGLTEQDSRTISSASTAQTLYLDEITWDNGKVKFFSDDARDDIAGGYKLNKIEVSNNAGTIVRKVEFNYDYFTGLAKYGDFFVNGNFQPPATNAFPNTLSYRSKRLKLLSVEVDDMPPHTFTYNSGDMPYKSAFAVDLWGNFNGVNHDNITNPLQYSLLPDPLNLGYYDENFVQSFINWPGLMLGKRYPDENAMKSGILTKVTYPTGGATEFEYEANRYLPPAGVSLNVGEVNKSALDGNSSYDRKQVEFTIPAINATSNYNRGKIDIRLGCGCRDIYNTSLCDVYVSGSLLNLANGLYVMLEMWNNSTSSWSLLEVWDYSDYDITRNNGLFSQPYNFIQGNTYRLTANYPDRLECSPGDLFNTRAAYISATYFDYSAIVKPNIGGGLRIKSITNYDVDNRVASKKKISYEGGVLMTKPVFLRYAHRSPTTFKAQACYTPNPCNGCDVLADYLPFTVPGTNVQVDERYLVGYYSEPIVPYSYSANGSAVGYSKVTEENVSQKDNGRTEYVYYNKKDIILNTQEAIFFPGAAGGVNYENAVVPGIPSIKERMNGSLISATVYKCTSPGVYDKVKQTDYLYRLDHITTYWAYKTEVTGTSGLEALANSLGCYSSNWTQCNDLLSNFLYFYPVETAKVNLVEKVEKNYQGTNSFEITTNYMYNTFDQVFSEYITDSRGDFFSNNTTYPLDAHPAGSVPVEMRNRNMVDYPIETSVRNDTKDHNIGKTLYEYSLWQSGAFIAPSARKTSIEGITWDTEVTYDNYDNKGNVLQYTEKDGVTTCIVWGYNQTYPIALIKGVTYANVLSALGQWDPNLPYLQTMNDAALETELNTLRTNLQAWYPLAMVTTYLYVPLIGLKQVTDPNGRKSFYEYESFGRLKLIRDQNGDIIKTFDYHYGQ